MNQFKMLRAMIYVFVVAGWLTFLLGIVLAAASFINNTWTAQLQLPMMFNSPITTGFAVLLGASILTIVWLASAEMLVLMLALYDDIKNVHGFFHKK